MYLSHLESFKDKQLRLSRSGGRCRRLGSGHRVDRDGAASPEAASWIAHQLCAVGVRKRAAKIKEWIGNSSVISSLV